MNPSDLVSKHIEKDVKDVVVDWVIRVRITRYDNCSKVKKCFREEWEKPYRGRVEISKRIFRKTCESKL